MILPRNESEILPVHLLEQLLVETRDTLFRKKRNLIKIDFAIKGFKPIKNVVLQRNGIFGYFLYRQASSKLTQGEQSDLSCMVRIQRRDQFIQVFFESGLVLMNDTKHQVNMLAI
jgi:hypothetical protein